MKLYLEAWRDDVENHNGSPDNAMKSRWPKKLPTVFESQTTWQGLKQLKQVKGG